MSQHILAPGWLLDDDGAVLTAVHVLDGTRLSATGGLRDRLLGSGALTAADRALGHVDPALGALVTARETSTPVPATRSDVLRGTGWGRLFVELTGQCNETCVHCYADAGPGRTEALDWETIRGVVEDGAALGFRSIQLTGGDPLLSPHVVPAAELARELGIPTIEIYTNGLALQADVYRGLAAADACFAFSMYSASAAEHDAVTRVAGSHSRTSRAIERALAGGSEVRVGIISMDGDGDGAERAREYVASLGVQPGAIGVDRQRQVGRGVMAPDRLVRTAPRNGAGAPLGSPPRSSESHAPRTGFSGTAAVAYDGSIHPCIFSRACTLGHIGTQRLRDILDDPLPLRRADIAGLPDEVSRLSRHLTCWECRLRVSLLGGAPS